MDYTDVAFVFGTVLCLICGGFSSIGPDRSWKNYETTGHESMESFIPLEETEHRFVRQVASTAAFPASLKKQYNQFNEEFFEKLPAKAVAVSRNDSVLEGAAPLPDNVTAYKDENHIYYNVSFEKQNASQYYVNLDKYNDSVAVHEGLSKSHLKAAGIQLSFGFPFYGYQLRNITLATGGFLYTGNPDHSWIAATQYIAPLMADFEFGNDSVIRYYDNGTALTIEWKNAFLHDRKSVGPFSFQATLRDDGTIIFYYGKIPISIQSIPNDTHPVKIGMSDAYMIDRQRFIIRYRTIYEYHRIALKDENITSGTAYVFKALPTCIARTTCESCLFKNPVPGCTWCDAVQRCSDGVDRFHQEWHSAGCPLTSSNSTCNATMGATTQKMTVKLTKAAFKTSNKTVPAEGPLKKAGLSSFNSDISNYTTNSRNRTPPSTDPNSGLTDKSKYTMIGSNTSGTALPVKSQNPGVQAVPVPSATNYTVAVTAVVIVVVIGVILAWVIYAYLRPQTASGQWLIKYRPTQWRRNREDEIQIASTAF